MKKALFVISVFQFSRETFPVLEYFAKKGWEVHVLVGFSGATADTFIEQCWNAGFIVHRVSERLRYGDPYSSQGQRAGALTPNGSSLHPRRLLAAIGLRCLLIPMRLAITFGRLLLRLHRIKDFARNFISRLNPDVVLGGPYHSCGAFDEGIAWVCTRRRILYGCLNVSPYLGEKNAIEARFNNIAAGMLPKNLEVNHNMLNKVMARLFPAWTRVRDGQRIFMFQPIVMFSAWLSGLLPQNPWQQPSEWYDVVFAESEFSRNLLLDSHYDAAKIVLTGKPVLDRVMERLRDEEYRASLCRDLGLANNETFILVNVEPSAEHHYAPREVHWQRFHSVMECLQRTGRTVVLSLHPLCDPRNYLFVETQYGFKIALTHKITELYPYCDFVVSFPCSTNHLSLVFNKQLVIYDFVGMTKESNSRSEQYRLPGASYAYSSDELCRVLAEISVQRIPGPSPTSAPSYPATACDTIYTYVSVRLGGAS